MTDDTQYDGVEITLGRQTYVLPAIPLHALPKCKRLLEGTDDPFGDDKYHQAIIDSLYYSLKRNYPDIDPTFVTESIDVQMLQTLPAKIMEANGLSAVTEDGEKKAAKRGRTSSATGTSTSSTQPSAADGQSNTSDES